MDDQREPIDESSDSDDSSDSESVGESRDSEPVDDSNHEGPSDRSTKKRPPLAIFVGIALIALIGIGGYGLLQSRSDNEPASSASDPNDDQGLPEDAVGTAVVDKKGDVFVVESEPRRWVRVYDASAENSPSAIGATVGGSVLAYVLSDGSAKMYEVGGETRGSTGIWRSDNDKGKAMSVDASGKRVAIVTSEGNVYERDFKSGSESDSVIWKADQGVADAVVMVKGGAFVKHDGGKVVYLAHDNNHEPTQLGIEEVVELDARGSRVVALTRTGDVVTVPEPDASPEVVWEAKNAESKVVDIALGANLIMLFDDGTVHSKSLKDPANSGDGRSVWDQVEKWGAATTIGVEDKLIMFQVADGKARWVEPSAPKGKKGGVYFPKTGSEAVASFAS